MDNKSRPNLYGDKNYVSVDKYFKHTLRPA